jgi:hypothetical protein
MRTFIKLINEYNNNEYDPEYREFIKQKLILQLRPSSNFTAFKRWFIRDRSWLLEDFEDYIN